MKISKTPYFVAATGLFAILLVLAPHIMTARQSIGNVKIDPDNLAGVVTSAKGPEAGVWVIAETTDMPTRLIKIVITDDRGRYLLPDLPLANYSVWVRGYGLVDSAKVKTRPGKILNLTATTAPDPKAAAAYYPAIYWFSLIHVPPESDFPGTGPGGNGISENMKSQGQWVRQLKTDGCVTCHQLGNKATREIPEEFGKLPNSIATWQRRVQSGQAGPGMFATLNSFGPRGAKMFADWTDSIAGGALPQAPPPRPQGIERNVVITLWDWADSHAYLHDEIATDKRDPTVNAYGALYGSAELSADYLPYLDPVLGSIGKVPSPVLDTKTSIVAPQSGIMPSPYWGDEAIWNSKTNVHNPMLDEGGRVWVTSRIRSNEIPPCVEKAQIIRPRSSFL